MYARTITRLLTLFVVFAGGSARAELEVVTTTTDAAALVEILGGDAVQVTSLAKGYQDPHYLEARPSNMRRLRDADLLVYVGLELEVGWLPLVLDGSRNPRLRPGEPGHLALSHGIDVLEVPTGEVSRTEGDVHPLGNPHYWLDPRNLRVMARTLSERMAELDPANEGVFAANLDGFERELTRRILGWEEIMSPFRGEAIVCYHKQWEYLFAWLGIDVVDYVEVKAGIPPSPRHVARLEHLMRDEGVGVIVMSNFFEPAPAERIASRTGAKLVVLPASVGGEDGTEDPFAFFDHLVGELASAFRESSK